MKAGFTLIETLATTALAALLMLAGLKVIESVGRSRAALVRDDEAISPAHLLEVLRRDLANSRFMKLDGAGLALTGYGSLDRGTLSPTHRRAQVVYAVKRAAGRSLLVREQRDLDGRTNRDRWSELVCRGVKRFAVEPVPSPAENGSATDARDDDVDADERGRGASAPDRGLEQPSGAVPVPGRVRIILVFDDSPQQPVNELVILR